MWPPSCPWSHGLGPKKKTLLVWRCHQLLSGFLSQRPLSPSVASVTSVANDKGDNEMVLGAVNRSPGICLTVEENSRKLQETSARRPSDEGIVRPVVASNGVPFLQIRLVRKGEGRNKERTRSELSSETFYHSVIFTSVGICVLFLFHFMFLIHWYYERSFLKIFSLVSWMFFVWLFVIPSLPPIQLVFFIFTIYANCEFINSNSTS